MPMRGVWATAFRASQSSWIQGETAEDFARESDSHDVLQILQGPDICRHTETPQETLKNGQQLYPPCPQIDFP